jgi:hypothetical protein
MAHGGFATIDCQLVLVTKLTAVLKARSGRDRAKALRIEGQNALQAQDGVKQHEAQRIEGQHGQCVGEPALLALRIDAGDPKKNGSTGRSNTGERNVRSPENTFAI